MINNGYFECSYPVGTFNCNANFKLKISSLVEFLQDIAYWHSVEVGCDYESMLKMGYAWILYKWKIRVYNFPSAGDTIKIVTWSSGLERKQAVRSFRIMNGSGELIGEALSVWVVLDVNTRTAISVPDEIKNKYTDIPDCLLKNELISNPLRLARNEISSDTHIVKPHDIDYNNHMNNAKYIEILTDVLPSDIFPSDSSYSYYDLEVIYRKESVLGSELKCICYDTDSTDNGKVFVSLIKQADVENDKQANVYFKLSLSS